MRQGLDSARGAPRAALSLVLAVVLLLALPISISLSFAQEAKSTNRFFLPQNPVAAAYVLGRLSNKELIEAPRSEFVYVALLQRKGLERKYRLEALDGLAQIRKSDRLGELIKGLAELDKKGPDAEPILQDLSSILLSAKPEELATKRDALEKLFSDSQSASARQIGLAALVTSDRTIDRAWKESEGKPSQLADLLLAIPLIRDSNLRSGLYARVDSLVRQGEPAEVRRAAIAALVAVPGHDAESFKTLSGLAQSGTERAAAVSSLQRLPKKSWPKEEAEPLLRSLIGYLEKTPANERTEADFLSAIQLATDLTTLLPREVAGAFSKTLRSLGPTIVVIRTIYEQMLYDKQLIAVEPGRTVEIILENSDAMPHNLVVATPGSIEEIGVAAEKMSPEPDAQGRLYVPDLPRVLHATRMVDPGQKTKLTFTAPTDPGEYPYLCTFPGHWRRMTGVLAVAADVDAYLATRAANEPKVTEWKVEDLASELANAPSSHGVATGQELFTKLGCAQCHKLGKEGPGYGPDLTDVFKKWKGDRVAVLRQIIEPSKAIEDRYKTYEVILNDGDSMFGMIAKEDGEQLTLQTGPADNLVQTVKKSSIKERRPQNYSVMPAGLLNTLSKEQILDLLAFIEAGGDVSAHKHK